MLMANKYRLFIRSFVNCFIGTLDRDLSLRTLAALIFLFALWLLMSGLFTPLLVSLGGGSVLVVIIVSKRMNAVDNDRINLALSPLRFAGYLVWLMVEIAKANWAVTKIILSRKMTIRQHMFAVPYSQKTDLGQVIFANSITLTPGTITVEIEAGNYLVHAVDYSDDDPAALADMDARVTGAEMVGVH